MFTFKKKRAVSQDPDDHLIYLQKLKGLVIRLKLVCEKMKGSKLKKDVQDITQTTENILQCLIDDHQKIRKRTLYITYYLPEFVGILEQYAAIKENNLTGGQARNTAKQIELFVPKAREAFQRILEGIVIDDPLDTEVDIKIMLEELREKDLL